VFVNQHDCIECEEGRRGVCKVSGFEHELLPRPDLDKLLIVKIYSGVAVNAVLHCLQPLVLKDGIELKNIQTVTTIAQQEFLNYAQYLVAVPPLAKEVAHLELVGVDLGLLHIGPTGTDELLVDVLDRGFEAADFAHDHHRDADLHNVDEAVNFVH